MTVDECMASLAGWTKGMMTFARLRRKEKLLIGDVQNLTRMANLHAGGWPSYWTAVRRDRERDRFLRKRDWLIGRLARLQRRIRTAVPIEHRDGWAVLGRTCPFCGQFHEHRAPGWHAAECGGTTRVVAADGTVVKRGGYIVLGG